MKRYIFYIEYIDTEEVMANTQEEAEDTFLNKHPSARITVVTAEPNKATHDS